MSRRVFAELLGFHRSTKGLSQEQLAEASDTDPDTIGKLERGQRQPRPSTARLLADALKLSPEEELAFMTAASGRAAPPDPPVPGAPLPSELTTFVGREQEAGAVRRLLGEHRQERQRRHRLDAERLGDGRHDELGISSRSQIDLPDTP